MCSLNTMSGEFTKENKLFGLLLSGHLDWYHEMGTDIERLKNSTEK